MQSALGDEEANPAENDLSKPVVKVESASKVLPKKACALFAGVKDTKVCSICFKGEQVVRCRGPCALYMHVECGDKPRFVPGADHRGADESGRRKSKKRLGGPGRKRKEVKSESDDTESLNDSTREETPISGTRIPDLLGTTVGLHDEADASIGDTNGTALPSCDVPSELVVNGFHTDDPTPNGDAQCENPSNESSDRERIDESPNPEHVSDFKETIDDHEGSLVEKMMDEAPSMPKGEIEKSALLAGCESFPDPSGISTPPSEESGESPVRDGSPVLNGDVDVKGKTTEVEDHFCAQNLEPIEKAESTTSDSSEKEKNGCGLKKDAKEKGWMCSLCVSNVLGPCFTCGLDEGERVRCKSAVCGKVFHLECMKEWPQHSLKQNSKGKMVFSCPAHTCHTCISDNPSCLTSRYLNDRLVRCMKCPTTYHHGNHCIPAGSEILTATQIICPRHFRLGRKSLSHLNASWCFLCSVGGSLICCDLCPTAFHVECLKISPPEGAYICEDCETGRFPLYGEIVWVKLGMYRWWPARILFPHEIPPRLLKVEHVPGEFAVMFYGTKDHYWVNRGRVFLFHEGDGAKQESINAVNSKKSMHEAFHKGVREASEDFIIWNEKRNHLEESHRPTMKPPKYTKITSNKPVGSVKMTEADASSLTACECSPNAKDPCGPNSDCINRLLLVECDPETCPAKDKCMNRNFEQRLYPPLMAFRTESRGWGLKTLAPLKKGDFIIEYVGEMIDEEEYRRRLQEMQKNKDQNFYFLTLDKDRMLDAGPKGNLSRFMNHSCQPNCETQKWTVVGITRVGLFALQDIPADSELVFNYNLMTTGDSKIECRCGAPNCAGYIGGKPTKPPAKLKDCCANNKAQNGRIKKKRKTKKLKKSLAKIALTNSSLNALSSVETPKCSMCNENGATIACYEPQCSKMYHLACTHLTKEPKQYTCPSHECSTCRSRSKVENCSLCINSYCSEHKEGNMIMNREKGSLCRNCYESDSGSEWSMGGKDDETTSPTQQPLTSETEDVSGTSNVTPSLAINHF